MECETKLQFSKEAILKNQPVESGFLRGIVENIVHEHLNLIIGVDKGLNDHRIIQIKFGYVGYIHLI